MEPTFQLEECTVERCFDLAQTPDLNASRRLALLLMGYLRPRLLTRVSTDLDDWSRLVRYVTDDDTGFGGLSTGEQVWVRAVLDTFDSSLPIEHVAVEELARLAECPPALQIFLARVGSVWASNIAIGAPDAAKLVDAAVKQRAEAPREPLAVDWKPFNINDYAVMPAR